MDTVTADPAQLAPIRDAFVEKIGLVAQAEGLPRNAGRIFGALVFDGGAIAFGELAEGLQISRATVSTSIRVLEERGLVQRLNRPGQRQDFFQMADDAYPTMLEGARKRSRQARDQIGATLTDLPPGAQDIRHRLERYSQFYEAISDCLGTAIDQVSKPRT